jgi:hypothetical protein
MATLATGEDKWATNKSSCVRSKSVGLADQDSYGTPLIFKKFDLAQLANGFGLLRLWMR